MDSDERPEPVAGSQQKNSGAQPPGDTQSTDPNSQIGDGDEVTTDS